MTRRISGLSSTIIKHIGVISFGEIIGLERPRENRHALPISYGWGAPFSWVGVPIWIAECDPLAYASGSVRVRSALGPVRTLGTTKRSHRTKRAHCAHGTARVSEWV